MWKVDEIDEASGMVWIRAIDREEGDSSSKIVEMICAADQFISPPNFIERFFGITFEKKIEKAIKKCEKWCRQKNAKEDKCREAIRLLTLKKF